MKRLPFRLRVQKKLCDLISTVSVENGYNFDLEGVVFRGRSIFGDDDPIPLVSILEAPLPDTPLNSPQGGTQVVSNYDLFIQGWVEDDYENPTDPAQMLAADVKKVIATERRNANTADKILGMKGRVMDIRFGGCSVRPAEEFASSYANFMLMVTLQIAENLYDPYQ